MALQSRIEVVLDDPLAVCSVGKRKIEHLRVAHCLLQSILRLLVFALCLDHCDRKSGFDLEDIVGAERPVAAMVPCPRSATRDRNDLAIGDRVLLDKARVPAGRL